MTRGIVSEGDSGGGGGGRFENVVAILVLNDRRQYRVHEANDLSSTQFNTPRVCVYFKVDTT